MPGRSFARGVEPLKVGQVLVATHAQHRSTEGTISLATQHIDSWAWVAMAPACLFMLDLLLGTKNTRGPQGGNPRLWSGRFAFFASLIGALWMPRRATSEQEERSPCN